MTGLEKLRDMAAGRPPYGSGLTGCQRDACQQAAEEHTQALSALAVATMARSEAVDALEKTRAELAVTAAALKASRSRLAALRGQRA